MHLVLQWAQIQPRIVYDETVLRDGLDDFRVLVMPHCDVLTEGVAARIAAFQERGGIVVADETLCSAITADIVVPSFKRTGKADEDKAALQAKAARLREELDPRYRRHADSSNPDVVVRLRQYGTADYLFAVNDKRKFGEYVGHHGRVMERGLPANARLSVRRASGHVYDLVAHKAVPVTQAGDSVEFGASFGPGDGGLFLITDQAIADVVVKAPARAALSTSLPLGISIVDEAGKPVAAVVPLSVQVLDPAGQPSEFSGFYAAKDGRLTITADLASNDPAGEWTIRVKELASGIAREAKIAVSAGE
jgi:hypothetical protein